MKSKEAAGAAAAWGSSLVGSAVQSYGVGALINATGTLSYKGAAYLGSLIFMASSAPSVRNTHLSSTFRKEMVQANIFMCSSSLKSSRRNVLSTLLQWEPLPVSSRPSVSACSLPTGEPTPTPSTNRINFECRA